MVDVLASMLIAMYSALLLLVMHQLCQIFMFRHDTWSFQHAVLWCTLAWLPLRIIFWTKTLMDNTWSVQLEVQIFRLPILFQFAACTMIITFYQKVMNWRRWNRMRRRAVLKNTATLAVVWVMFLVISIMEYGELGNEDAAEKKARRNYRKIRRGGECVIFLWLAVQLAWNSLLFSRLPRQQMVQAMLPRSPKALVRLNILLGTAFFSQFCYECALLGTDWVPSYQVGGLVRD